MKKSKKFSRAEKDAWLAGKIAGYYAAKAAARRKAKQKMKYSTFDPGEAFARALERTYGKDG